MTTSNNTSKLSARRARRNPNLVAKISQMRFVLSPLVQMTTGAVHPAFPSTMLHFYLLTDAQLEDLAHFYHQRTPCFLTNMYPMPMNWRTGLTTREKMRKWGRFMGLRGCESPLAVKTEEELWEEARQARMADEEGILKKKTEQY